MCMTFSQCIGLLPPWAARREAGHMGSGPRHLGTHTVRINYSGVMDMDQALGSFTLL